LYQAGFRINCYSHSIGGPFAPVSCNTGKILPSIFFSA
jgi:hypothetical protein